MCFSISISKDIDYVQRRFGAVFPDPADFEPIYHVSAFTLPSLPVISSESPGEIGRFTWGLVPFWTRNAEHAGEIRTKTFNARAETVFDKPSFRDAVRNRRCLVLADGFYEWHEAGGRKYPYYVRLKDGVAFALAGIWDSWSGGAGVLPMRTFSIITTKANPLLERVHNTRKRMPVILPPDLEGRWLSPSLERDEVESMLVPFDDAAMEAYPVARPMPGRTGGTNTPRAVERYDYPELQRTQARLF